MGSTPARHQYAFLHGYIDEEVYMLPPKPKGYHKAQLGQVCKLVRFLRSLKQAFRQWNLELTKFLIQQGFTQSTSNYSLFSKVSSTNSIYVLYMWIIFL